MVFFDASCNINLKQYNLQEYTSNNCYSEYHCSDCHCKCRSINTTVSYQHPQMRYKTQKEIQKTVRVSSSLFTMNLGALNVYAKPLSTYKTINNGSLYLVSPGVNWNQMSDRANPHIQTVKTASGSGYRSSSTRSSITRLRPGSLSPGGLGVDIKHNSYDRYLNRLKGKGPLRQSKTYPTSGKTLIINCNC